jgi:hypothetical protein
MENEYGQRVYRKLLYFSERGQAVHFTTSETGAFYNGIILDLNEDKQTLVLQEFKLGSIPFLLEDINEDSIAAFTIKDKENKK